MHPTACKARPCSSPAPRAASAWRSQCAPRATAPTSCCWPRPPSRTPSCRARCTRPPRRSRPPAARRCRCRPTSATRTRWPPRWRRRWRRFGGIDILVNNASAISLTPTDATPMKRFDLMFGVNVRGTYLLHAGLPAGADQERAGRAQPARAEHEPAADMKPHWFQDHVAYTMAKYGMSDVHARPCRRSSSATASRSTACGRARRSPPRRCR